MLKQLFRKKTPSILGLDIGTRFVKAVLLEPQTQGYRVVDFACEAIHGDAFAEREIKDFDAVSNALRKIRMGLQQKIKPVAIAVSGSSVISKVVYMNPGQSDHELETQIEIEADSLIPYPLEEVYIDFEELGPSKAYTDKVDVLLSAAHKDLIDSRVTLLREVEFEPKVVDVEGYALANAMDYFAGNAPEQLSCCINIGASQLLLSVTQNDQVVYAKEHSFGVDSLLQDLCLQLGQDRATSEQQLLHNQLPDNWRSDNYPIFLANLQQQISRSLQMYVSTTNSERPEQLYLSGGGALIIGLAEDLARDLAIDINVLDPFANMQLGKGVDKDKLAKVAPQLVLAAGLASRGIVPCHM